jgi:hypothetical protein
VLIAVAIAGILAIALTPTPVDRPYAALIAQLVTTVRRWPALAWFDYRALEGISNVLLFVPLGVIATALVSRWWTVPLATLVLSSLVEIAQSLFLPERTGSVVDVAANAAGATLGAAASALVRALRHRAPPPPPGERTEHMRGRPPS